MLVIPNSGDQVSKKGSMTGGFHDHRRSKLKFMNIIKNSADSIHSKEEELEKVRIELQNILFMFMIFIFIKLNFIVLKLKIYNGTARYMYRRYTRKIYVLFGWIKNIFLVIMVLISSGHIFCFCLTNLTDRPENHWTCCWAAEVWCWTRSW